MPEINFKLDETKCVKCGMCVKDCISHCIEQEGNSFPQFNQNKEESCLKCQHCFSVCPTGAINIFGKTSSDSDIIKENNSNDLLNLIKSRRSVRYYKSENLDNERMSKLKDMLKWVPTGCNFHNMHFSFVDDIEVMDDIRTKINQKVNNAFKNKIIYKALDKLSNYRDALINGEDIIFRGAPHMVIVSTPIKAPCANIDPIIALSYFDLYAQSMGVGTLWCGFADMCFKVFPDMCKYINIPEGYKVSYVMLFGKPDIKYSRTTQPENFVIESVTLHKDDIKMPFLAQAKRVITNFLR